MKEAELEIWMGDRRVGTLDGSDRRSLRVVYGEEWCDDPSATPLSVSMPIAGRTYTGRTVSSYLWGLLPDNERVLTRWARTFQCSATDVFGLLKGVGGDVAGAARYVRNEDVKGASGFDRLSDHDVAGLLQQAKLDATAWHSQSRGQWSLAGAQTKIALAFDNRLKAWGVPSGTRPTTHILKPAIGGLSDHDINEHLCLRVAAVLGMRAAETHIRSFDDQRALVVTRYDRLQRDGIDVRVHQEDCCQALGVHPHSKYQADGGPGIEDLGKLIREVVLTHQDGNTEVDVNALVRAAAFNWLILGTDAHAKNYSLLLSGPQVRFAPLYDVASVAPYEPYAKKLKLAQKIGGEYRAGYVSRRHWERTAKSVRIDSDLLRADIIEMAERLPDAFAFAITESELATSELVPAARLVNTLKPWVEHCVATLSD
jgi:serine/threonine-protein kinase HipA